MHANSPWDEIVIGAGSAGAVLAGRLSEQPCRRVLLLEAGPDLAAAHAAVAGEHDWDFEANARAGGPPVPYFLGKVVGGTSAVNGSLAVRGLEEDFRSWAAAGHAQWDWAQVLPYFRKLEADRDFSGPLHGREGPMPIGRADLAKLQPLQAALLSACRHAGLADIADLNASSLSGVGALPSNAVEGVRISTASAYLDPARGRPNLVVRSDCMVSRILFDGSRAIGVELHSNGRPEVVLAQRITLCAGAINTAALLLRSGVGNEARCRKLGVTPVVDLPGVGENLMDHASVMLWMVPRADVAGAGVEDHHVMARVSSRLGENPDLNLLVRGNIDSASVPMLRDLLRTPVAHAISVVLCRPASRGRVFLEDAAASASPVIELDLCSAPDDVARLMVGMRLAWKIARSQPVSAHAESIFMWSDRIVGNDNLLSNAIKRFAGPTWHPAGTARMGPASDPMAVVDQRCRVHRTESLRIVDASVMPAITSAPTNLTCIMLAERMADSMRNDLTEGDRS